MSLVVRPADLDADAEAMVKLLAGCLNPRYDRTRLDWLYRQNPDGAGRAWLALDGDTGELVGCAAAIPRRVFIGDYEALAFVLSDFCMAAGYRALGPALKLQRACLELVSTGEGRFCYDFPAVGMMAIYRRLGLSPVGQMRRLAKPVRVDSRVRALGLPAPVGRLLTATGNLLLAPGRLRASADEGEVSRHFGACGVEFSDLDAGWRGVPVLRIRRSHDYLNWRFLANPFEAFEILTLRAHGKLLGYAAIASDPTAPTIVDVFGPPDLKVIGRLVRGVVAHLTAVGATTVNATLLESHPWMEVLTRLGFRLRESSPVVLYAPADGQSPPGLLSASWLLSHGDRDS